MGAAPPGRELLLERELELATIGEALARCAGGNGSLLVIRGAAGAGKTRMLELARALADDGLVFSARGAEFESQFPFGVVRQLFDRLLAGSATAHDRPTTLAAVLLGGAGHRAGSAQAGAAAEFDIVNAVYWLVVDRAAAGPLLLLVDDAHWADDASLRALAYLARRLDDLPVVLVIAVRGGEDIPSGALRELLAEQVGAHLHPLPLSPAGSGRLVGLLMGADIDDSVALACHAATGGNPFLLSQLACALAGTAVKPSVRAIETIKELAPESLVDAVMLRLGALSRAAVAVGRAISVLGDGAELRAVAALAGLDHNEAVVTVAALTRAGILADRPTIGFVHPLVRAGVYGELSGVECADWHERAYELLEAAADVEQLAGHLLLVAPRGAAGRARALRAAGRLASARGAHRAAAGLLRRALAEPPIADEALGVLLECGLAELHAGDCVAAAMHLRKALADLVDPDQRVEAALGLARALVVAECTASAVAALDAAGTDIDAERGLRLDVERTTFALYDAGLARAAQERMRDYARLLGATPAERIALANAALAVGFDPTATAEEATQLARRALADGRLVAEQGCEAASIGQALYPLMFAGEFDTVEREIGHVMAEARRRGSVFGALNQLGNCMVNVERGELAAAVADGEAVWRIARELARSPVVLRWGAAIVRFLAEAHIERGALDDAAALLAEATEGLDLDGPDGSLCRHARGLLALATGDAAAAQREFDAFGAVARVTGYEERNSRWRLGAAVAAKMLGDEVRARALAKEDLALARVWGAPGGIGAAQRVHALVGEPEQAAIRLAQAVVTLEPTPYRLLRAHALVDLGVAHRRLGSRNAARRPLAQGMDLAASCQAAPLVERAHRELVVIGARPRRPRLSGIDSLTPSERRVATLAARGLTNCAIAHALFVTPKTVENHLAVVFRKLGVSGRRRLPSELAEPD